MFRGQLVQGRGAISAAASASAAASLVVRAAPRVRAPRASDRPGYTTSNVLQCSRSRTGQNVGQPDHCECENPFVRSAQPSLSRRTQ